MYRCMIKSKETNRSDLKIYRYTHPSETTYSHSLFPIRPQPPTPSTKTHTNNPNTPPRSSDGIPSSEPKRSERRIPRKMAPVVERCSERQSSWSAPETLKDGVLINESAFPRLPSLLPETARLVSPRDARARDSAAGDPDASATCATSISFPRLTGPVSVAAPRPPRPMPARSTADASLHHYKTSTSSLRPFQVPSFLPTFKDHLQNPIK